MNPVALAQSQNFFTLLQALAAAGAGDVAQSVEAKLIALAGDGTATAEIAGRTVTLQLAGPQARQAALQPGATLVLQLTSPEAGETASRATLVEIRPPAGAGPAPSPNATIPQPGSAAPGPVPPVVPAAGASPPVAAAPVAVQTQSAESAAPALATRPTQSSAHPVHPQPAASPAEIRNQIGPMLSAALRNQDGLAPLLANLRSLTEGSVSLTVPRPLLQLAEGLLRQALPTEAPITAPQLREAVRASGLFHEARQAVPPADTENGIPRTRPAEASPAQPTRPAATAADLKTQLTVLRDVSAELVEKLAPKTASVTTEPSVPLASQPADRSRLAPPRRDLPLPAQAITEPTLAQGERPLAIAETLMRQSDAALDRLTLTQFASLPPDQPRADTSAQQRWLVEIPLAFQNGQAVMPLEIERDAPRRDGEGVAAPSWQMRFALDVEPLGPLQGFISLRGRSVGVTLWAEREPTTHLLRGAAPGLEAALLGAEFEAGTVDIRSGHPAVRQATAGQFFDRTS